MVYRIDQNNNDLLFKFNITDIDGNVIMLDGDYIDEVRIQFYTTLTDSPDRYDVTSLDPQQPADFVNNQIVLPSYNLGLFSTGELMVDIEIDFIIPDGITGDDSWHVKKIWDSGVYIVNDNPPRNPVVPTPTPTND